MKKNSVTVLVLILSVCAALCSPVLIPTIGTSIAVIVSSCLTGIVFYYFRKALPETAGLPSAVLIGASSAVIILMLLFAFLYFIARKINIVFTILAAVILAVLSGMENGYSEKAYLKNSLRNALIFVLLIIISSALRELLGNGSLADIEIPFISNYNIPILNRVSGGFIVLAIVVASVRRIFPPVVSKVLQGDGLGSEFAMRISNKAIPKTFMGIPIILLAAGLLSMVFFAFI